MEPITKWSGEFEFLRNDYLASVVYEGKTYPSVEHAFQAAKTGDEALRDSICKASTAREAKKLGRSITDLPADWDAKKLLIMEFLVRQKVEGNELADRLMDT